jgi:hypothetical protein
MKTHLLVLAVMFSLAGFCFAGEAVKAVPVITEHKEVVKHIGEKVTIVGEVTNTKVPQILGVDVSSNEPDLRGKRAQATGILERYEVTPAQAQEMDRIGIAHRGAGTFYRLWDEKRKTEAQVKARK